MGDVEYQNGPTKMRTLRGKRTRGGVGAGQRPYEVQSVSARQESSTGARRARSSCKKLETNECDRAGRNGEGGTGEILHVQPYLADRRLAVVAPSLGTGPRRWRPEGGHLLGGRFWKRSCRRSTVALPRAECRTNTSSHRGPRLQPLQTGRYLDAPIETTFAGQLAGVSLRRQGPRQRGVCLLLSRTKEVSWLDKRTPALPALATSCSPVHSPLVPSPPSSPPLGSKPGSGRSDTKRPRARRHRGYESIRGCSPRLWKRRASATKRVVGVGDRGE